jgi:hypothetical protein
MCVLPYLGFYFNIMKTSNVPFVAMAVKLQEVPVGAPSPAYSELFNTDDPAAQ